jgi:hypothetical protein
MRELYLETDTAIPQWEAVHAVEVATMRRELGGTVALQETQHRHIEGPNGERYEVVSTRILVEP